MPLLRDGCPFCAIVRDGPFVARTDGFVAINDISPQAETHILIIPERHLETFRDVAELEAKEAKRMLDFTAEVARDAGLTDYQVIANVGGSAGQTVFHLHWHVIGDTRSHLEAATLSVVREA